MNKEPNPYDPPKKKWGRIAFYSVSGCVLLLLLLTMLSRLILQEGKESPSLFGYSPYLVQTSSMEPTIRQGAIAFVQKTAPDSLNEGELVYLREEQPDGSLRLYPRRISKIIDEGNGRQFQTKADDSPAPDETLHNEDGVVGKVTGEILWIGQLFSFLKTPVGLIICLAVPLAILLVLEIFNLIAFSRNREEPASKSSLPEKAFPSDPAFPAIDRKALFDETKLQTTAHPAEPEPLPAVRLREPEPASPVSKPQPALPDPKASAAPLEEKLEIAREEEPIQPVSFTRPKQVDTAPDLTRITQEFSISPVPSAPPKQAPDQFRIDGIDMEVRADEVRLNVGADGIPRKLLIRLSRDGSRVLVSSGEHEVEFALQTGGPSTEQKVVVQKKTRTTS